MGQVFKLIAVLACSILMGSAALAAPYAAMVVDARTGEVLHARNADARLHPASLTKMMTLYVVFDAIERGEISLSTRVRVSKHAANEEPSKLGLKRGQYITVQNLIRGAAVKSANDAATALGEALSGSEARFARRMTSTAKRIGMKRTTFKNAHGLTQAGHLSTARDMTLLGRRLFYDFPQYYNLFSRKSTHTGVRKVYNTNRKLLSNYSGADGIKTGYTRAAGFNLVASAERGQKRVIATVFGGRTPVSRNQKVAELLDLGFSRSPNRVAVRKPKRVDLGVRSAKAITRSTGLVKTSLLPTGRPGAVIDPAVLVASIDERGIEDAIALVATPTTKAPVPPNALASSLRPLLRPDPNKAADVKVAALPNDAGRSDVSEPKIVQKIVSRSSVLTTGDWAVYLGDFPNRFSAEKHLLKTALSEMESLETAGRKIDYRTVKGKKMYRARFTGLSQKNAMRACSRIQARAQTCMMIAPGA